MISRMKIQFLSSLLAIVLLAAATGCKEEKPKPPPVPKVTVALPQKMVVTNWDEFPGHLEAVEQVEVRARVGGYLDSIHFQDGAMVKAGDLLFTIDRKPFQAELDRMVAARKQAETKLELAHNDAGRANALRGTKAISAEELDGRVQAEREAESALAAAKAGEEATRLNLEYTKILSPIDGRIGRRMVTVGNLIQANGTPMLSTVVTLSPIYCYFDAPEDAYYRYRHAREPDPSKPAPAVGSLPCELRLAHDTGFVHSGRVDFFDNQVDPKTGTIRLRGVFTNENLSLMPGMFATVRVPTGLPVEALMIPDTAVQSDQNYKYACVVNATNTIEFRPIKIGRASGPWRAVLEGLTPQDRVVINGLVSARRGAKVEPQTEAEAAAKPIAGTNTAKAPEH